MVELVEQQALALLGLLEIGDVEQDADDAPDPAGRRIGRRLPAGPLPSERRRRAGGYDIELIGALLRRQ